MLKAITLVQVVILNLLFLLQGNAQNQAASTEIRTLLFFFDGLRPDYITADDMPNLYAFKQQATYGTRHHSVFPTVTRLNASSYATGSYPKTHGIMGNVIFIPQVSTSKTLNTGNAKDLMKVADATNGNLLTTVSLAEVLASHGKNMMVFSSGSTGQALLQNHKVKGNGIINTDMILPESLKEKVHKELGPAQSNKQPDEERHQWAVDALLKYGLAPDGPQVSAIWLSDPDHAGHANGVGVPPVKAALKSVDRQFGRVISEMKNRGLLERYNIIISVDHGFVTYVGKKSLTEFLIEEGFKKSKESDDIVVADGALYLKDKNPDTIRKIVQALQQQPWVGAIFTKAAKPGDMKGWVEGTLSFDAIHWNHPERAADILVDRNWDDRVNSAGYAGAGFAKGAGGHGGLSPYEVKIPLIVSGPSFKKIKEYNLPTSNVDITPTVLALYNIPVPASMDGRVLADLMVGKAPSKNKIKEETISTKASYAGGTYELQLKQTKFGKYRYIDYAKVIRTSSSK